MSYYLFIFSSHQHVKHMTSQILLTLIDFLAIFNLKLLFFKPLELEEILRNGKGRSS